MRGKKAVKKKKKKKEPAQSADNVKSMKKKVNDNHTHDGGSELAEDSDDDMIIVRRDLAPSAPESVIAEKNGVNDVEEALSEISEEYRPVEIGKNRKKKMQRKALKVKLKMRR